MRQRRMIFFECFKQSKMSTDKRGQISGDGYLFNRPRLER